MAILRILVAGIMIGTLYGLVATSLTLMVRSTGVLSFAHAGFALLGAYSYGGIICPEDHVFHRPCGDAPMSPVVAALAAIVFVTVVALVFERLVARPLRHASTVTKVVATAGFLALVSGVLLQIYGSQPRTVPTSASRQLLPIGTRDIGGVVVSEAHLAIFVISAVLVTGLGFFLRRSWFGLAVRAAGQLPDVSRLMGVSPIAVSRFNWALGGALSALAGVLIGPITLLNIGTFSFLLAKAVGATLLGGLVSLPLTFAGGIAIGAVEAIVPHFWDTQGASEVGIAALVVGMLLVYGRRFALLGGYGAASGLVGGAPGPLRVAAADWLDALRQLTGRVPRAVWILVGIGALILPLHNAYYASVGVLAEYYCLLALSVVVLTGTTGQLSFMQAGFAAVGAFGISTALAHTSNLLLAFAITELVCVAIGIVVGVASLRFRGLEFTIASVALGAVLSEFAVTRGGVKSTIIDPHVFGHSLLETKNLYLLMLVVTGLALLVVANLRRSLWGRTLGSMREMHTRVGHFGVRPVRSEVALLALSAGIAGLGGAALALTVGTLTTFLFVPLLSVTIVLTAVVGGLRSLWGPIIAGLVFGPGQEIVGRTFSTESGNAFPQIAAAVLAILLVVGMPNGLASLFAWARTVRARGSGRRSALAFRGKALPEATAHALAQAVHARGQRRNGRSSEPQPAAGAGPLSTAAAAPANGA